MNKIQKANLVLVQLETLKNGDFEKDSINQLCILNEVLRSSKELAEIVLKEQEVNEELEAA